MRRKTKLTVVAATLAAGLLAAPIAFAPGSGHGAERPMMGPGMMGGMMGQMGEMMEQCQQMMQGMMGGQRPNEQWRRPDEQGEAAPEEQSRAPLDDGDRPRVVAQLIDGDGVSRALDHGLIVKPTGFIGQVRQLLPW